MGKLTAAVTAALTASLSISIPTVAALFTCIRSKCLLFIITITNITLQTKYKSLDPFRVYASSTST